MSHNNIRLDCVEQESEGLRQSLLLRQIVHSLCRRRVNICFQHLNRTCLLQYPLDDSACVADCRAPFFSGRQRAHLPFVQVGCEPSRLIETIALRQKPQKSDDISVAGLKPTMNALQFKGDPSHTNGRKSFDLPIRPDRFSSNSLIALMAYPLTAV